MGTSLTYSPQDATTWMNLEDVTLGEISQTQKGRCCVTSLTGGHWRGQIHRDRKQDGERWVVRDGEGALVFNEYGVYV